MAALTLLVARTLTDPKVVLTIDPVSRTMKTEVTETCPRCNGYGSPCPECAGSGSIRHDVVTSTPLGTHLAKEIGPEAAQDVIDLLLVLCARQGVCQSCDGRGSDGPGGCRSCGKHSV